ncbi:MAG TPA: YIP1 family protein [Polyangiaceae bacterium]|nr:YIP1 family protein [Polyangiaceae bacterium]
MNTPSQRIHDLVQKGALPAEQGETLLAAIRPSAPHSKRLWLDPLERVSGERLALIGLGVAGLGAALRFFRIAFDGFIDLHVVEGSRWPSALAEAAVAWPLGALVLWVVSLVAGRQGRFIDFLGVVAVARVPLVASGVLLVPLTYLNPRPLFTPEHPPELGVKMLAMALVGTAGLICCVTLLYRGFVTASGLKGPPRVVAFVAGALVAEIASKATLIALSRALLHT